MVATTPPSKGASTQITRKPQMIEVALGKHGAVIMTNIIKKVNGDAQKLYDVPKASTKSVDYFVVPRVHQRQAIREASCRSCLGVNGASV